MSGGITTDPPLPDAEFRPGGRLPPPLPRSNIHSKSSTLHSQDSERLVLVRNPPRERLARAKSSAEPEETLLARVEAKQYPYRHSTTTTTSTRSSNPSVPFPSPSAGSPTIEDEFFTDLYQYYYDVTTPPTSNELPPASSGRVKPKSKSVSSTKSNAPSKKGKHEKDRAQDLEPDDGSDTERDERPDSGLVMAKKRGSLQAIFVPSFLQTSAPSDMSPSPPSSPTSTTSTASTTASKVVQRLRALSAVTQPSPPSAHTTFSDIAPSDIGGTSAVVGENGGISPPLHQRKRSTTFSIMTSFNANTNYASSSSIPSPTTPTGPSHSTILSPRNSPPPAFLQDDDPFANLTSAPSESMVIRSHNTPLHDASSSAQTPLPPVAHLIPRSPLNETVPLLLPSVGSVVLGGASSSGGLIGSVPSSAAIPAPTAAPMLPSPLSNAVLPNKNAPIALAPSLPSVSVSTSTPQKIKPKSAPSSPPTSAPPSVSTFSGPHPLLNTHSSHPYHPPPSSPRLVSARPQPRPAHQRPAFSLRPSLPSLNTLARMNVVLTKKVRKGRVGAGLPFEPWDLPSDDESLPTPPPPLSASASSSNSARLIPISSHNGPTSSNGIMNAEPSAAPNLNVNVNLNANHDYSSAHPITTPSSTVNSIPPASASFSSSPIPIPLSNSPSSSSSSSSSASLASGSGSYIDVDSDSGSSSNSTTPTTASLISTVSRTRSRPPSPSPSPLYMNIAKPQPLLPSQILALGSVAADVEMIIPVGNSGPNSMSMWSNLETVSRSSSQYAQPSRTTSPPMPMVESNPIQEASGSSAPILPAIAPAGPLLIQTSMTMNGQSDFLSESQDAKPEDGIVEEQARYIEYEERDEYFDVLLDRYQVPSRAGSDDGLEVEEEVEREAEVVAGSAEPPIQQELVTVLEESQWLKGTTEEADEDVQPLPEHAPAVTVPESTGTQETREENITTSEHPSIHTGSGDVDVDVEAGTSPGLTRSDSFFSSPPSSASLSRSFSMTSDSSIGSAESGSGVEHTGRRPEDMWSYRRFGGDPSQSLSSLELDFDAHREDESEGGLFEADVDAPSISRGRAGTRSSSDDGDALQLTTPGDDEHGFFPYSHAGTFARFYQSAYSTLFSPPVPYKEDGPSYLPETGHFNLSSSSSSVDDLGGEREAEMWGKAFVEEGTDMTMPGGFGAAELSHRNESGLGNDKVLIAAEECQRDDVEKEKESLANTTSIAPVRTTSTITTEADRLSHPSSDHSQPVPSSSSSSIPVDQETSPLHSESVTQAIDSPGALIDDEMVTRHRMGPSNDGPPRPRPTTINPRTSSSTTEPMDSSGYQRHGSSNSQQYRTRASHEQTTNYNTSGSTSISAAFRGDGRRGERKRNSDDEEEERRRRRAVERMRWDDGVAKFAGSTSSSEEDDYGEAASKSRLASWKTTTAGTRSPPPADSFMVASSRSPSIKRMDFPSSSNHSSQYVTEDEREEDDEEDDDDDDVPLAQRIPGALTAQKTMRRKFREEREQRKKEKAERMQHEAERRARQETLRPAGAGVVLHDGVGAVPSSSSQDAALFAAYAVHGQTRQRTLTLPGKSPTSPPSALNPHDLARKLQNVQMTEVSSLAHQQQYQYPQQYHDPQAALSPTHVRAKSISRTSAEHQQSRSPSHPVAPPLPPLTTVRSRSIKDPSPTYQIPPGTSPISPSPHGPPAGTLRPMRSFHRPSERRPIGTEEPVPALPSPHTDIDHRLGRSSTSASRSPHHRSPSLSRTSADRPERVMEPVPPLPAPFKVFQGNDESKKLVKPNPAQEVRSPSTRVSGDADRSPRMAIAQQPMPGLVNVNKVLTSQQRVFVGNLQQFHMVEIGPSTTAGDVVAMMEAEGALKGWAGIGGWMVYEIAQDFGMERPVRSYELLADVQASWLKDKSVNFFVLKLTPLAAPLSRNAIPASSPTHSGYIEWEAKRGKWSKRWLQLREHNLYLAKRDNGKDEVLICSLSNFDAYQITRNHRAPKAFAFAIKSTDNLSFFENTADYMHTFSCNEKDGKIWLEKILVARSYVLHQERHILFKPAGNNASAAVSRSGTKKYAPVRPNHQPLVALAPNGVFEPGSLLGKHI